MATNGVKKIFSFFKQHTKFLGVFEGRATKKPSDRTPLCNQIYASITKDHFCFKSIMA